VRDFQLAYACYLGDEDDLEVRWAIFSIRVCPGGGSRQTAVSLRFVVDYRLSVTHALGMPITR